jgi:GNAT superfamily N-acetyltransferase
MIHQLREVRARAKEEGWRPVLSLIGQALRNRITNPWHLMFWIPTAEVHPPPLPVNGSFMVLTDPVLQLDPAQRKALFEALGPRSGKQAEERMAQGALLHVLFIGDRVAGTVFTVSGAARRFQHMVLTDADSMGMDARVLPEFRGQGFFALLLAHAIHALRARGQERFFGDALETNAASRRTMEKLGFRYLTRYRVSWRRHYQFAEAPL